MDKEVKQHITDPALQTAPQEPAAVEPAEKPTRGRAKYNKFALISIVLAVGAWIALSFEGKIALAISVVAFICGCIGLKSSTRTWRNTAVTSLVASAVLMVVLTAFLIVIFVGLNSL